MALNMLKKRLETLESRRLPVLDISLSERIARYESIIERGDYSSPEGQRLIATIEKYEHAIEEIAEE